MDLKGFWENMRSQGFSPNLDRTTETSAAVAQRMMSEAQEVVFKYPYGVYVPYRAKTRKLIEDWCNEHYRDEHYADLNHFRFTTEAAAIHFKLTWG